MKSNSATLLASPQTWDRKGANLKPVVKPAAAILESRGLDWTVVVGRYLGRSHPTGMIADFLGEKVINALKL